MKHVIAVLASVAVWQTGTINRTLMLRNPEIGYIVPIEVYEFMIYIGAASFLLALFALSIKVIHKGE